MRIGILVTLLLIMSAPALAEISILDADGATLELKITAGARFISGGPDAYVSEASADLSWIPRETWNQDVESLTTTPKASVKDTALFYWTKPTLSSHNISVTSIIVTNNGITPVMDEPPFPLVNIDPDLIPYTQPSEMIDSNADIRALASTLAAGKDNQYKVIFALADWVTTNIEYNLSTLTATAVYPSSWVLENGYGVCDEMTNLFISLVRALGIPARFVSGLAYTNMEELPTNWGGHGWAEVYFPGVGWIPFDVTYGEYGYVDAGHIKLKDSIDSKETSIEFRGTGYRFNIESQPLDFDVKVLGSSPRNYEFIEAELTAFADTVRFGSYNLLTLRLKNLREYYVSTRVELGETTQMEHMSPDTQNILLDPLEERKFYFLVKVSENLDRKFIYTFPIAAFTKLGAPAETTFTAMDNGPMFDEDAFVQEFSSTQKKDAAVDIDCTAPTPVKETANIMCTFTNIGERISGMVCIDKNCSAVTLRDTYTKVITLSRDEPGVYTVPVSFSNEEVQKSQFVTVHILDETTVEIRNVTFPETIRFGEEGILSFTLIRTSASSPIKSRIRISHELFKQEWSQEQGVTTGEYNLRFTGDRLKAGENVITFTAEYQDPFGEWHETSQIRKISLVDLTFGQKLTLWLDSVDRWLQEKLSSGK